MKAKYKMTIDEREIIYKCQNGIGNSLDLKIMTAEALEILSNQTLASNAYFYIQLHQNNFELISQKGKMENFNLEAYKKNCTVFNIIQDKQHQQLLLLPLNKGILVLTYADSRTDNDFLTSLCQGLIKKLNFSIESCLKLKELEEKNKSLKLLAKELNKQREELIDSNRFKDIYLANMSHELKTPLNSIQVISSVMAKNKDSKLNEAQVKNIKIINSCGKDLLLLINDVLDISKLEAGEVLLDFEEIDVYQVLEELKEAFKPLMKHQGLSFECKFDKDIGIMYTDKNRLRQIIKNLLSNALKFVQEGKIRFSLKNREEKVDFIIKDDGIGIPKDKLDYIFNRFKQVDKNVSKKYGGSGLGLAISKELSHLLGGEISVNSKINKGTTFILTLPKTTKKSQKKTK